MFLEDARTRLQSRLAALLRRSTEDARPPVADELWLSQKEAARMLQPYIPKRNALAWLELDRNVEPSLPFAVREGEIVYRLTDVKAYIRRLPQLAAVADRGRNPVERRHDEDRRCGELNDVMEERRLLIDRRSGFDRRTGVERRLVRDDFGYGRKGERRGGGSPT